MNVIIIDDEEHARENLKRRLLKIDSDINIIDMLSNAEEGYVSIKNNDPDVVFIDIEMPGGDGFSLLEKFDTIKFDIVFVTAYNEYALKAFELLAIGYITKPIDTELLKRVYTKSKERHSKRLNKQVLDELVERIQNISKSIKVALPTERGLDLVVADSIVFIQSTDGYTNICIDQGKNLVSSKRLKYFEEKLDTNFIRMHKSVIVNSNYIKKYHKSGFIILMDGTELPVGRKYKVQIEKLIG